MTTKTTGAEFKRFYNDSAFWPEGAWHDDEVVTVDGESSPSDFNHIPDDAKVTVDGGIVFDLQGVDRGDEPSFEARFKKWRKAQTTEFLSIEVPKNMIAAVKTALKAMGVRV